MCISPIFIKDEKYKRKLGNIVPCGRCYQCLTNRKREWVWRMYKEAQYADNAIFITLTYDQENLERQCSVVDTDTGEIHEGVLVYADLQEFIKRIRSRQEYYLEKKYSHLKSGSAPIAKKIKYYACGEYGEKSGRPHFHLIMYNVLSAIQEEICITSPSSTEIDPNSVWKYGFATIGKWNVRRLAYTAKYVMKGTDQRWYAQKPKKFWPKALISRGLGDAMLKDPNIIKQFRENKIFEVQHPDLGKMKLPRRFMEKIHDKQDIQRYQIKSRLKMLKTERKRISKSNKLGEDWQRRKMEIINAEIRNHKKLLQKETI